VSLHADLASMQSTLDQVLDRLDEDPSYDPMSEHGFSPSDLNESEERLAAGKPPYEPEPDDDKGYKPAAVEF